MLERFDFVKAGKVTSVILKGGRNGLRKAAMRAYDKFKEYADEEENLPPACAGGRVDTGKNKEGESNGIV